MIPMHPAESLRFNRTGRKMASRLEDFVFTSVENNSFPLVICDMIHALKPKKQYKGTYKYLNQFISV